MQTLLFASVAHHAAEYLRALTKALFYWEKLYYYKNIFILFHVIMNFLLR